MNCSKKKFVKKPGNAGLFSFFQRIVPHAAACEFPASALLRAPCKKAGVTGRGSEIAAVY
jgi:hypothetical protein